MTVCSAFEGRVSNVYGQHRLSWAVQVQGGKSCTCPVVQTVSRIHYGDCTGMPAWVE